MSSVIEPPARFVEFVPVPTTSPLTINGALHHHAVHLKRPRSLHRGAVAGDSARHQERQRSSECCRR